jgi:hypothetical protein
VASVPEKAAEAASNPAVQAGVSFTLLAGGVILVIILVAGYLIFARKKKGL